MVRQLALELTTSDRAKVTGIIVFPTPCTCLCVVACRPDSGNGEARWAVELDESYFGLLRVRGKRGHGAIGKIIVFGLFKRGGLVFTELVPTCLKKIV